MDIFSNPTAYAAPVIDDNDDDPLADLGRDSYTQTAAGEENNTTYVENGFFYESVDVIERTQKIQKESGAYGLYYDVDNTANGNYYEPAAGGSYTFGDGDDSALSDQVKDFRAKIQKPLSSSIQDFAKSYYWNERFQALLERPTFTPKEIALRQADIDHFVQEFVLVAKPVCEQIVKEISVPVEKKQVKPIAAGGIAGGEKYLHKDLFLKFARDHIQIQLYGGDEWAQKAAFHELKSLTALISCGVPNLHFPMMCLVKCYGHCLVVVSKLPLSGNTLIYGSANAAVDIKTDNYDMETMLKQVTQTLNLKPHQVLETSTKMLKTLYGPVDIEGHQGLDGRYYVVDTARLFPPATPIAKVKGCHLYKLLRPELVKSNPVPLSSDAFSSFGRPNQKEHNDEAREATRRVLADIIPNKLARNKGFLTQSVKDELHSHGVNVRYLGSVYAHSKDRSHPNYDRDVHLILLIELIARAFKGVLFSEWRKIESEIPSRSKVVAVKYFNLLLGQGQSVNNFWMSGLKEAMVKRFIFYPETDSTDDFEKHVQYAQSVLEPNMHSTICQSQGCRAKLFERAVALTGVEFVKTITEEIRKKHDNFFNAPHPFNQGDVTNIQLLAKYIEVKPFMDVLRANFEEAEKFYLDELKSRREILGDDHMQLALTHINLGDLYSDRNKKEQAEEQYNLALRIMKTVDADQNDVADLREKRTDFYIKFDMLDKAEAELNTVINLKVKYLKEKGFSQDNLAVAALKDKQARVYTKQQRFQEAKVVLEDVIRIKQAKFDHFHWQVAKSLNNLAQVMFAQKEYSKAEPICQNVLDILIRQRGPEHSEVGIALDNLAKIYAATGRRERAQKLLEQAKDIKVKAFGDTHTYVGITLDHLASNLLATVTNNHPNKETVLEECKTYYEKALSIFKATYGDVHAALGITNNNLGLLHLKLHKYEEALNYFEKAHQIFIETVGPASPQTMATQNNIQLIKQSSADVLDTLDFEQAYHSGEMYADASEKPVDESTQLDEATAALIRELGFDPSQFTKTQAAQILEMLNSIQTETPTPAPTDTTKPQGYGDLAYGESDDDEYSGSGTSEASSSSDWEGYGEEENKPTEYAEESKPTEYAEVKNTAQMELLSDVKPYLDNSARSVGSTTVSASTDLDQNAQLEKVLSEQLPNRPKLKKKSSSKFFDSFKAGVRSAFSFWKSKDKKSEAKGYEYEDRNSRPQLSVVPIPESNLPIVEIEPLVKPVDSYDGYAYSDNAPRTAEEKNGEAYSAYSIAYDDPGEDDSDVVQVSGDKDTPERASVVQRRSSISNAYSAYETAYETPYDAPEKDDADEKEMPVEEVPAMTVATEELFLEYGQGNQNNKSAVVSETFDLNLAKPQSTNAFMVRDSLASNFAASSRTFGIAGPAGDSRDPRMPSPSPPPPPSDTQAPPPPPGFGPVEAQTTTTKLSPRAPSSMAPPLPMPLSPGRPQTLNDQLPPPGKGVVQMQRQSVGSIAPGTSAYDAPPSQKTTPTGHAPPRATVAVTPTSARKLRNTVATQSQAESEPTTLTLPTSTSQSTLTVKPVEPQSDKLSKSSAASSFRSSSSSVGGGAPGAPSNTNARGRLARHQPAVSTTEVPQEQSPDVKLVRRRSRDTEKEKEIRKESPRAKKDIPFMAPPAAKQAAVSRETKSVSKDVLKSEVEAPRKFAKPAKPITQIPTKDEKMKPASKAKDKKEEKKAKKDKGEKEKKEKKEEKYDEAEPKRKSKKKGFTSYSEPMEPAGNLSKISSFYAEESVPVPAKFLAKKKTSTTSTSLKKERMPTTSAPMPQQQQQTPAALLNNLSEQQKEDLRKRLQQLAGSSRQVPVQQQQAPQQVPQQQPQQQALQQMQFNWTNI